MASKRSKSKPPGVVPGLEPRASAPVLVAAPVARRSRKCPVCRARPATTEIAVGPVNVKVCDQCGGLAYYGAGFLTALRGLF